MVGTWIPEGTDRRPIVYDICQNRSLPVLVADQVASYLVPCDLLAIARLSRQFYRQATPLIYSRINLDLGNPKRTVNRATLFLRTLLTNEMAADSVRSLSLSGDPLARWRRQLGSLYPGESTEEAFQGIKPPDFICRLEAFTSEERRAYKTISERSSIVSRSGAWQTTLPQLCLDIVISCVQLRHLSIESDYFRYTELRKGLRALAKDHHLDKLQTSCLCLDLLSGNGRYDRHLDAVQEWMDASLSPLLTPGIESVSTVMAKRPGLSPRLETSNITRLVLHHHQLQDSDLNSLLASTPRLRYLEYHAIVHWGWSSDHFHNAEKSRTMGIGALFNAVHHVRDTLEELVAYQSLEDDSYHFYGMMTGNCPNPCFWLHEELATLRHLHTLKIPYRSLLGWEQRNDQTWDWQRLLPNSIRRLTFTDGLCDNYSPDYWHDESLMPVFTGLLDWLTTKSRDNSVEFDLQLHHSDCDFNEPVRRELSGLCKERGIICSIDKQGRDRTRSPPHHMLRGRGRGRGRGTQRG